MPDNQTQNPTATGPVLVAGIGPIPPRKPDRLYAPGIRLWSFALALTQAGVETAILETYFDKSAQHRGTLHEVRTAPDGPPELDSRDLAGASLLQVVGEAVRETRCAAIVSTTDLVGAACAQVAGDTPFWCDLNGHPMAERQGLSHRYDSDEGLAPQWDDILPALLRADRFSTCSGPQRLALIGELGATGRLNRHTDGYDLVTSLPVAYARSGEQRPDSSPLRGKVVPDDAFVVLWAGGYNTWADADTLRQGLETAMLANPRIHFVSTGGAIDGHDDRTFAEFRQALEDSEIADRCHFAGWVPASDLDDWYALADVAILCDRPTLEGELGSRNRVLDWLIAGIPALCTDLCELTHEFAAQGLIDVFAPRDAEGLARQIERLANTPPDMLTLRAEEARRYCLDTHAPSHIYAPLIDWASSPQRAPDLPASASPDAPFDIPDNSLARRRLREWRDAASSETRPSLLRRLARAINPENPE